MFAILLAIGIMWLGVSALGQEIRQVIVISLLGEPFYTSNSGIIEIEVLNGYTGTLTISDHQEIKSGMTVRINALNATGTKALYENNIWDPNAINCSLTNLPQEVSVLDGPRVDSDGYTWYQVQAKNCSGWVVERFGSALILEPFSAQEILEKLNPQLTPTATWAPTPTTTATHTATATATLSPTQTATVTATPTINVVDARVNTDGSKLNLRSGPTTISDVLTQLVAGSIITVFPNSEADGWVRSLALGYDGWVFKDYLIYLETTPVPTPTPEH